MNERTGTAIGSGDGRLFVAPSPEELNRALPNFEVECLIGQGGMGAVYKARQPKLDRFVAIKVVPAILGQSEHNFAERFQREARAMAGLNHPNIVTVHDFGETENGYLYIVMEYVDGRDMHHAIVTGQVGVIEALAWMMQLCEAIQYAHDHDVVHRDIKPANILINKEGQVKVGDFGLVKLVGRKKETAITLSQVAMGTPDYSAPESLEEGGVVDHRADVYSMGVLLYELLTGKVPRGAWQPPSAFVPVNPRLDHVVVKAMQPDPDQRYQSAEQLKEAIHVVRSIGALDVAGGKTKSTERELIPANRGGVKAHELTQRSRKRDSPLMQAILALVIAVSVGVILVLADQTRALRSVSKGESGEDGSRRPSGSARVPTPSQPRRNADVPGQSAEASAGLRVIGVKDGWADVLSCLSFPRDLVSGRWKTQGKALKPQAQKDSDRSRFRVPLLLEPSYELALEVAYQSEIVPFALTLPLRSGPVPVLIGEAGLPNEPPFLAIGGGVVTSRHGRPETTRRFPVSLSSPGSHAFTVRVLNRNEEVGIIILVDGVERGRFVGALSDLEPEEKKLEVLSRQIVFGASGSLEVRSFRARSLPSQEWLPEPERLLPSRKLAAKAPPVPAPVKEHAKGKAAGEEPGGEPASPVEVMRQKIAEVEADFGKREQDFARTTYDVEVASLREKYNAALNRTIQENDSISVRAAVQREQMRIRDGERVEDTDPPEMPEIVKKARAIYRQELAKLDEQLHLALAPVIREHLESLNALEKERVASGQYPEPARALLVEARKGVEQRLEKVRGFLDAVAKSRNAVEGGSGATLSAPGGASAP